MGIDNVLLMVPRVNFNNSIKKRKEITVLLNVVFLAACPASSIPINDSYIPESALTVQPLWFYS